ncbi:MAG: hypothetical protein ACK5M7_16265 [Draconibacterium sp.]
MKKTSLLLLTLLLFFSCETDFEQDSVQSLDSSQVEESKVWIDSRTGPVLEMTPDDLGIASLSGKGNDTPILFQYDWEHAFQEENENYSVVEVPLMTQGWYGMAVEETLEKYKETKNMGYMSSITRLILIKDKKKTNKDIEGYIMTIFGDVDYLEKKEFQLLKNTYLQKEDDFSGTVLFRTLSGRFVNGWQMRNGQVTKKISESKKQMNLTASTYCNTYAVYTTYQQCTDWYNVGETSDATYVTYNGSSCNIWQEYSGSYTECETVHVNTGSGGSSSGPYVQGGDTYCKSGLKSTMQTQVEAACVPAIMGYITNEYCDGDVNYGFYILDYVQHYGGTQFSFDGVSPMNVSNFTNRHFETTGFVGYQNAIDNGHIMMAGIPTTTPGIGHNVAIVGYKSNGDLIYMDPEVGYFQDRPASFFASNASYVMTITGCK